MNRTLTAIGLIVALAAPASALAGPPSQAAKHAAIKQCKAERGKTRATRTAFKATYHSFSRCVRRQTAEEKAELKAAIRNAAQECKAQRSADPDAFAELYGKGHNAYGKCVSSTAKQNKADMDEQDSKDAAEFRNDAKECAAERGEMGDDGFAQKYGTNGNKRNAFGKCVSERDDDEPGEDDSHDS
jgi:hypothetical protein